MNLTKSVRQLAIDIDITPDEFDMNDTHFNSIFDLLDKDKSGALSREEAFTLVRLFESEKTKSASLKKNLLAVAGISAAIILVLGVATVGAVFIAVNATKETKVSSSGALMTKDGSRQLSTISQGTRFQLFNTSEDTPLCIAAETFEEIQSNVLQGSKVVLDVEEEGLNERSVIIIDGTDGKIMSQSTCFDSKDGKPGACFYKSNCLSEGQRRLDGESTEGWGFTTCGLVSVTDAAQCGTETVTDGIKCGTLTLTDGDICGTETVTDAAKCGSIIVSRNPIKKKANTCTVVKTCSVPKTCTVPKTCNVPGC